MLSWTERKKVEEGGGLKWRANRWRGVVEHYEKAKEREKRAVE